MFRKIVLVMAILAVATAATAQVPSSVDVRLPQGAASVMSEEISGTLASNGITCTWVNNANSATINFVGNYTPGFGNPKIMVTWLDYGYAMPMNITATAAGSTAGAVHFSAPYMQLSGVWSYEHDSAVSTDWNWGTTFPGNNWMAMTFELTEPGVDYDVTIAVEWGPGVPVDVSTWGDIKALYR